MALQGDVDHIDDKSMSSNGSAFDIMSLEEPDDQSTCSSDQAFDRCSKDGECNFISISYPESITFNQEILPECQLQNGITFNQEILPECQLQNIIGELIVQHEVMESEIKTLIEEHLVTTIEELTAEKLSMYKGHTRHDLITSGAVVAVLGCSFIPVVGWCVSLGASMVIIAKYLQKIRNSNKAMKLTVNQEKNFKEACKPAWEAYEAVMQLFRKYCEEYAKCYPESSEMKKLDSHATVAASLKSNHDGAEQEELSAPQSTGFESAFKSLVGIIASTLKKANEKANAIGDEKTSRFISFIKKAEPAAKRIPYASVILAGISGGYVLLDEIDNFFSPCQRIEHNIARLENFGLQLQHVIEKSKLTIMFMESVTKRMKDQRQIKQLSSEKQCLLSELTHLKQYHLKELKYQAQQHKNQLQAEKEQYENNLKLGEEKHLRQLEAEKKRYKESIEIEQKAHAAKLDAEKMLYQDKLGQQQQQHENFVKCERELHTKKLEDEKKQHQESIQNFKDEMRAIISTIK